MHFYKHSPQAKTITLFCTLTLLLFATLLSAQQDEVIDSPPPVSKKAWHDKIAFRGYSQLRHNGLFETNPDLSCEQCDKAWGQGKTFTMRRIRIALYGQVHPRVFVYVQQDIASSAGSTQQISQLKDAYADVGLDDDNEFRFRFGQSKVPFGFENMQSSSRRLPLDRNDGINSALKNERDLGVFFYWAPKKIRQRFRELGSAMKHSGDYGMFGIGMYNGQTATKNELNDNKHIVTRFTYPFLIGNQIIEPALQAYTGQYHLSSLSEGVKFDPDKDYLDQRLAASFILYPKPFGIMAEYNIGQGPEFNGVDSITTQNLHGGYVTLNYRFEHNKQVFFPFIRAQYYDGGKKHEKDARSYTVKELELGIEWQIFKNFEIVAMYTFSDRRYEDYANPINQQSGSLMRFQAQFNY